MFWKMNGWRGRDEVPGTGNGDRDEGRRAEKTTDRGASDGSPTKPVMRRARFAESVGEAAKSEKKHAGATFGADGVDDVPKRLTVPLFS